MTERRARRRGINLLSDREVKALTKRGRYHDGGNLVLEVSPTGNKAWFFLYMRDGKSHQVRLGNYLDVPLAEAREKAAAYRRLLKVEGVDPLARKRAEDQARRGGGSTFKEVAELHLKAQRQVWKGGKDGRSEAQWRSTFDNYIYPAIGDQPVSAVTDDMVLRILEPIWTTKAETASRVRSRIENVLDYATARKLRSGENPARWKGHLDKLLPKQRVKQKGHDALDYKGIAAFVSALRLQPGIAARALEFTILTAARTGEVIEARWGEIDLEERAWTIPAERMKAEKAHRVPLSDDAIALLRALPRRSRKEGEAEEQRGAELLFKGGDGKGNKPLSNNAMLALLKRMKVKDVTVHGFRSTFRDWAGETTAHPREVIEMALAHTVGGKAERAYWRKDILEKRRRLMDDWASFCSRPAAAPADNVRSIREAAHA